ncbi:MAG: hypothetical protein HYS27_17955 [Deltaproteobacteria bacterium]|nr:hypothetical protein [Deltaproteobacteria bacterium]
MGVDRVSSARQSQHTRAIGRAVELALADIKKVQHRMTEELRVEDAVRGLELHGREVHVLVDDKFGYKPAGLRDLVKGLLAKHGAPGVRVELRHLKPTVSVAEAVRAAQASIAQVQRRLTTDLRAEDDIAGVSEHGGRVTVALRAHPHFDDAAIKAAVLEHLKKAGLKSAAIDFIRPAIDPIRPPGLPIGGIAPVPASPMKKAVADFAAHVTKVQSRLTEELRIEDAIVSVKLTGAKVAVKYWKATAFGEDNIKDFVRRELRARGVTLPIVFSIKDPRDV